MSKSAKVSKNFERSRQTRPAGAQAHHPLMKWDESSASFVILRHFLHIWVRIYIQDVFLVVSHCLVGYLVLSSVAGFDYLGGEAVVWFAREWAIKGSKQKGSPFFVVFRSQTSFHLLRALVVVVWIVIQSRCPIFVALVGFPWSNLLFFFR